MITIIDLKRVADLGAEFVSLAEAKSQLIIDFTDDDSKITALISQARRRLESYLNISIIYQRVQLIGTFDSDWKLPWGPVIGIESVEDSTNPQGSGPTTFTTTTGDWRSDGGRFYPVENCLRYRITYTAGNYCPDDLKSVWLKLIAHLYENRGKSLNEDDVYQILKEADHYKVLLYV